jgi:SAM-dependent methyltransferase
VTGPTSGPAQPPLPGYHDTARAPLLALLPPRPPRRALELGCGAGRTLALLRQRHPGVHTTGVERDTAALAAARAAGDIDTLIEADILDPALLRDARAGFDLVIVSHVLEHFEHPERVLDRVRGWLAPDGHVLAALPNLRHLSVLLPLVLRAEFEYRDAGILDRTHLRFFSRHSAERFFRAQGWAVEAAAADVNGTKSRALDRLSLGLARDFAAFAWNFRLRPA